MDGNANTLGNSIPREFSPRRRNILSAVPKIALSYRRKDSDAITGRIRNRLARYFGERSVFMDIDNIPLGIDCREHIRDAP